MPTSFHPVDEVLPLPKRIGLGIVLASTPAARPNAASTRQAGAEADAALAAPIAEHV